MDNTKIISITGLERGDFPYFLSRALEEKRFRVLTIDNSCSHDLFLSLKRADEKTDYAERGRCVYMRNKYVEADRMGAFEKFDAVIMFHGLNADYDLLEMSDKVVLMTDYTPSGIRYIREYVDMEYMEGLPKDNLILLYRDRPGPKLAEQFIQSQFGLTGIENEAAVDYDEGDYNAYISFCYNGVQRLKGLSPGMRAAIHMVRTLATGSGKKGGRRNDRISKGCGEQPV